MALTILRNEVNRIPGGNGRVEQWGSFTFTGTNLTGDIPVKMSQVEKIHLDFEGAQSADERLYSDVIPAGGVYVVPASGTVTVKRAATSPTSGIQVGYRILGI